VAGWLTRERVQRIRAGDGGRARARHYAGLLRPWAQRAAAIRWNRVRAAQGRPLLPVPEVPQVHTPRADEMRERRELERRRAAYDGRPYDERRVSDPAKRRPRARPYS